MSFLIDPRLKAEGEVIADLGLSRLILVNNRLFPWMILVPMRDDLTEIIDLTPDDQAELFGEIAFVSHMMREVFEPDKLNIASLGNIVSQLHVHIIGRFETDVAWPKPAFGSPVEKYDPAEYKKFKKVLADIIEYE